MTGAGENAWPSRVGGEGEAPLALAPKPLPPDQREPWGSFLHSMFWVGVNTFGGPVAQIGVMHQEAVEKRRWLTDGQFMHLLNFANVLPGPEALEIAIHLGYLRRGVTGGIAAGLLFIWPGFVTLTALAWGYKRFGEIGMVGAFLEGVRPIAVALIAFAALRLALKTLKGIAACALMGVAFAASFAVGTPFILLLGGSGLLGLWLARLKGPRVRLPESVIPSVLIVLAIVAGFLFRPRDAVVHPRIEDRQSWTIGQPAGGETVPGGPPHLAEIAVVNTKAALVTFGGAYTVLPYLREQMSQKRAWVTDQEIVDALALGETTPGPLICFGIFLSYLAGGFPGAVVGCVFLFLPSFVLVLGLGRHIERVETLPGARQFLWGVSVGTLGLILSLTAQVLPGLVNDTFDWVIAAAAFLALWRLKTNIILTVVTGGLLGLARCFLT